MRSSSSKETIATITGFFVLAIVAVFALVFLTQEINRTSEAVDTSRIIQDLEILKNPEPDSGNNR
jgi:biopolymer transport protein ExbB/TolQ